jgi:MFS family permease
MALLAPAIKQDLGLSDTELSLLLGLAFALFNTLTTIPAGWMVDRFSRRAILSTAALLWSAITAASGLASNFAQLFVGRAGVGLSEGALIPASFSMIRDSVPAASRGRAFSVYGLSTSIGNGAAFALVGAVLAVVGAGGTSIPIVGNLHSWQIVLMTIGTMCLPFAILPLFAQEKVRTAQAQPFLAGYRDAIRCIRAHWSFYLAITLFMGCISMLGTAFLAWLPSVAYRNFDIPLPKVGATLGGIAMICMPLGLLASGFVIDHLRRRGVERAAAWGGLAGLLATAVPTTAATLMPTASAFWIATMLSVLTLATLYQIANNLLALVTPQVLAGRIVALYTLGYSALAALGPSVVGLLSDLAFANHGERSLGYALATSSAVFIGFGLAAILWTIKSLKRLPLTETS